MQENTFGSRLPEPGDWNVSVTYSDHLGLKNNVRHLFKAEETDDPIRDTVEWFYQNYEDYKEVTYFLVEKIEP